MADSRRSLSPDALDFAPRLLAIQESPPARLPRTVLYVVLTLFFLLLAWSLIGKLDIIASAEGRLVPQTFVKIVQPADAGIVKDILVSEGQHVDAGQVLIRMDAHDAYADEASLRSQLALRGLQLRRIDDELGNIPFTRQPGDPDDLYRQAAAQYQDHHRTYLDTLGQTRDALTKAEREYDSGKEVLAKLEETVPILQQQADAYRDMGKDGYVPRLDMRDKEREYLEKARDLDSQKAVVDSLAAAVGAARKQVAQTTSKYRSDLQAERFEAEGEYRKLQQELAKQVYKNKLLELKAPQAGIVKDLSTHTVGTVVSPGAILLTLVPDEEPLMAEVMVKNEDVAFIHSHQPVKVKLAAYPFQEYGMLDGEVATISADASDDSQSSGNKDDKAKSSPASIYKAIIALHGQTLKSDGKAYPLVPGMQAIAEINEGQRTVMEYLLSPVQKAVQESGHER